MYGLSGPPAMTPPELRERLVLQGQMAIEGRKSREEQLLGTWGSELEGRCQTLKIKASGTVTPSSTARVLQSTVPTRMCKPRRQSEQSFRTTAC